MKRLASIDLGSHTARILVAEVSDAPRIKDIVRERHYVRLAVQGRAFFEGLSIPIAAQDRAIRALGRFSQLAASYGVDRIVGVATGVIRTATNRDAFLRRIYQETGLAIRVISGEEEAALTAKGVLSGVPGIRRPFIIFDLGGGSTEFYYGTEERETTLSIPMGAAVLTRRYLRQDPPDPHELVQLDEALSKLLTNELPHVLEGHKGLTVVGTGGTVTSLAAMAQGLELEDIYPEKLNGLAVTTSQIEEIFDKIKKLPVAKRAMLSGLDKGRADVIIAGALAVLSILHHFQVSSMVISLSDLLEGLLMEMMET
ncbi:MAG: hypothetical protein JRH08_00320 [Deltaproteobacteria bacterium]|nr:hypothetical protein [Deltaproteobacteria bacterium]MBW2023859.1 hypothetical protein [Deltaproteobacteria bacterium]MBW2124148.1 hypothetical protein [Deltaproteobacteria bacterium]